MSIPETQIRRPRAATTMTVGAAIAVLVWLISGAYAWRGYPVDHPAGEIVTVVLGAAALVIFVSIARLTEVRHGSAHAVIWLAQQVGKPILKLVEEDYNEHGLQELLSARGSAYDVNIQVFKSLRNTITGWPGGKPARPRFVPGKGVSAENGPDVFPKRVVVFSPHPDDDVISMGGTLIRLVQDRHEVHVAYMTSGNIAVFDHDAKQIADLVKEFNRLFGIDD